MSLIKEFVKQTGLLPLADRVRGYRTYAAAVILLALAGIAAHKGNWDRAGELLAAAMAAAGLRAALPTPPAPPAAAPAVPLVPNILGTNVAKTNGKTLP